MFGTLRFLLATAVVLFHTGVEPFGLWIGVSAVVVFYILSGYVITALIYARFPEPREYHLFIAERSLRIFPQYYLWVVAALFFTFALKWTTVNPATPSAWTLFSYTTLVPLALQRYTFDVNFPIIGPATTLAIEFICYLLAPFLVRSRSLASAAVLICLAVFYASATQAIQPQIYTYYSAPAPLVFFMLGSFIQRRDRLLLGLTTVALSAILIVGYSLTLYPEMLVGVLIGVPAILLLKEGKSGDLDTTLGNMSYGMFLCHNVILQALLYAGLKQPSWTLTASTTLLAWAAGWGSYLLVERPTVAFRRRIRGSRSALVEDNGGRAIPAPMDSAV